MLPAESLLAWPSVVSDRGGGVGSVFFLLPKGTPQLLAKLASVLVAVGGGVPGRPDPKGDERATWWEVVRRRLRNILDTPSENEPWGDGGPASAAES